MLTLVTAATDKTLLTIEELRSAAGVTGSGSDTALTTLGGEIAALIARHCNVAAAGVAEPTLRSEALNEIFRFGRSLPNLVLARRPVSAITGVSEDGAEVDPSEYEVDVPAGILYRLSGDARCYWPQAKISVAYTAGWTTVPFGLKKAAKMMVNDLWSSSTRDPNLKRVRIEGVSEREFWVPPTTDALITTEVAQVLAPYVNVTVG